MAKKDTVTNPRIAKLIELEVAGRIKPEHQLELDTYRAQGLVPKRVGKSDTESERKASAFLSRAIGANRSYEGTGEGPRGLVSQSLQDAAPNLSNVLVNSNERQVADSAQDEFIAASLRQDSGAAIPPEEMERQRRIYFPMPGDGPDVLAQKRAARLRAIDGLVQSAGNAVTDEQQKALQPYRDALSAAISGEVAPVSASGVAPEGSAQIVTEGATRQVSTEEDKAFAALAEAAFKGGAGRAEFDALAAKYGRQPFGKELDDALKSRETGGIVVFNPAQSKAVDTTAAERAAGALASSPVGAGITGVANGMLLGGADEVHGAVNSVLTGKPLKEAVAEADLRKSIIADRNPGAYMAGNIGGGVLSAYLAPAATGAKGILASRAIATDAALSATSGALEDNANRGRGVLSGLAYGVPGGIAGRALGRAIAPTGGASKPLYDAGVKPTPGQRFGGAVNVVEEALGSIPIVGSPVHGARQAAREQFERGAFDTALGDLGLKLPPDVSLGTPAHKFAQHRFAEAYDRARADMRFARDPEFETAFNDLAYSVATELPEPSAERFRSIVKNQVDVRMRGNALDGDAYKQAQSNLNKRIRNIRNNPSGDQELADALDDFSSLLDAGARRASPPQAVAALDAADAGYAKLVRIERAALGAGEAGRFTPTQFANAVKREAGGRASRSKAYLAGDALMQEYADAGLRLNDTLPDSGTPTRTLVAGGLTGAAGYVSPAALAAPVALTLPYIPGLRRATTQAIAPRESEKLGILGNYLVDGRVRASAPLALYGSSGQ